MARTVKRRMSNSCIEAKKRDSELIAFFWGLVLGFPEPVADLFQVAESQNHPNTSEPLSADEHLECNHPHLEEIEDLFEMF